MSDMKTQIEKLKRRKKIKKGATRLTDRLQRIYNGNIEAVLEYRKLRGRYFKEEMEGEDDE